MFRADEPLALARADVRFVIIGGIAVGVHGYVRATRHLDIVPDPDRANLVQLAHLLAEINAEHVGIGDFSAWACRWSSSRGEACSMCARFRSCLGRLRSGIG